MVYHFVSGERSVRTMSRCVRQLTACRPFRHCELLDEAPCRSVAGVHTTVCFPKQGIRATFDMGLATQTAVGQPTVFVTHQHMDHVGALHMHASLRRMTGQSLPTVYTPVACRDAVEAAIGAFAAVDGSDLPVSVLAVEPGDAVSCGGGRRSTLHKGCGIRADAELLPAAAASSAPASSDSAAASSDSTAAAAAAASAGSEPRDVAVRFQAESAVRGLSGCKPALTGVLALPVPTVHRAPSHGYALVRMSAKLLPELEGSEAAVIKARRSKGLPLSRLVPTLIAAVTGDTTAEGMLCQPAFTQAEVLVTECTFTHEGGEASAVERGHTHVAQLARAWAARRIQGRVMVLSHFSVRDGARAHARAAREAFEAALAGAGARLLGWRADGGGAVQWARRGPERAARGGSAVYVTAKSEPKGSMIHAVLCADCDDDEEAGWRRPAVLLALHGHAV